MHSMLLLAAAIAIAPSPEPSSRIADAVAELRLTGGGKIVLGDGVHYLESPLEFTAADSNVVLRAADGARPVLSAGRRISGGDSMGTDPAKALQNGYLSVKERKCAKAWLAHYALATIIVVDMMVADGL